MSSRISLVIQSLSKQKEGFFYTPRLFCSLLHCVCTDSDRYYSITAIDVEMYAFGGWFVYQTSAIASAFYTMWNCDFLYEIGS